MGESIRLESVGKSTHVCLLERRPGICILIETCVKSNKAANIRNKLNLPGTTLITVMVGYGLSGMRMFLTL